jgi:hypothetical protein
MTAAERRALADQERVEVWEFTKDESKRFTPWTFADVTAMKCLVREWYEELLDRLPEASDPQLRTLLREEHESSHPLLGFFMDNYMSHTMGATCRFMVDALFALSLEVIEKVHRARTDAKGNDLRFKEIMGKWIQKQKVYYSARDFEQVVHLDTLPVADVPAELRDLLSTRRASKARPGAGLLRRTAQSATDAHGELMHTQFSGVKRPRKG